MFDLADSDFEFFHTMECGFMRSIVLFKSDIWKSRKIVMMFEKNVMTV